MSTAAQHRPETAHQRAVRLAGEHFESFAGEHHMTVRMDAMADEPDAAQRKPYRHLRFAKPGSGFYAFEIVTWPGHLTISGDLSSYTFARLPDMFDFFRPARRGGPRAEPESALVPINPHYWAEKLIAGDHHTDRGTVPYSEEVFAELVGQEIEWARDRYPKSDFAALQQAAQEELLDELPGYREEACERLREFRWSPRGAQVAGLYSVSDSEFRFHEVLEWDFSCFDHGFLLACHAIAWGVSTYLTRYPDRLIKET